MRGILILVLALALSACVQGQEATDEGGMIRYHHDPAHGVGCWTVWGAGIYCLPDSQYFGEPDAS